MDEHYFTPSPATDDRRFPLRVRLAGRDLDLVSSASVFSGRGLDKATAVLLDRLDEVPAPPPGATIVDLGCGWGPIALTAALHHPDAEVWAVDVSERARELTSENARRAGLGNVRVVAPEEVSDGLVPDVLWSNPPIRIGKPALHALLEEWITRLAPQGTAALVVGRNLGADPLARHLGETFPARTVAKAASAKGFRVLVVGPAS
ncbi:class I SAM-dependent methyltransferase [Brachybacterium saurashtrense]|uniref:Methyltransferase domain-containing protein n=1 Tax=Brachybacterium saurashtrense TaxID=556288 RepID=A0A345YL13_9MICO|nr:methyltransferase [Brachybacterium saurashtrense]AXK44615.1 methyltransferase domain-containing protein [Brachybacterium saurashtrense]RRR23227.1 methyltransferase domain-containing protein [Brachybacterium saurashtrense]